MKGKEESPPTPHYGSELYHGKRDRWKAWRGKRATVHISDSPGFHTPPSRGLNGCRAMPGPLLPAFAVLVSSQKFFRSRMTTEKPSEGLSYAGSPFQFLSKST